MLWLALAIAVIAAALFTVSRKPDRFAIERSISIAAKPAEVFNWINNVRRFNQWNPWASMDPTSTITYSGPEEGPSASFAWSGKKTGQGSMTLTEQTSPSDVTFALEFIKPFKASNLASFTLSPNGGSTMVTWRMTGPNSFFNKLFQTFVNMDKMVGKDFEKGLANLKSLAEEKKLA